MYNGGIDIILPRLLLLTTDLKFFPLLLTGPLPDNTYNHKQMLHHTTSLFLFVDYDKTCERNAESSFLWVALLPVAGEGAVSRPIY